MPAGVPGRPPVSTEVATTLLRALAVLRVVVGIYAVVLDAARWRDFARPGLGWAVVALIVAWTLVAAWAYDAPRRRGWWLLALDFAVAAAALLATPVVESAAMLDRHASTLPSFWVVTAVLAWAVLRGWRGGLVAAVAMSLLDLSVRTQNSGTTWGNIFLLLLAAGVVGYSTQLISEATEARTVAERESAVLAERARLARAVHDGVLQVLALVQRRGLELGGEAAELGRLAGEQEAALRALVQGDALARTAPGGQADLAAALGVLGSRAVTVAVPATPVRMASPVVQELVAVVAACLDNVARHVGPDASSWVLLEQLDPEVVLTVRDEGPGIPEGRLRAARLEGRLGVVASIEGRVADLGGTTRVLTGPGTGTEWEIVVDPARAETLLAERPGATRALGQR